MTQAAPPACGPYVREVVGPVLSPGEGLGGYTVEACLGVTLLGGLYRMRRRNPDQRMLVVVLPEVVARSKRFLPQLESNLERLRGLDVPQLALPLGVRKLGRLICVEYEDCEGISLGDYLSGHGATPWLSAEETTFFLQELVEGLQGAQGVQLTHGCLLPQWVLVTAEGRLRLVGCGLMDALDGKTFEQLVTMGIRPMEEDVGHAELSALDILSPEAREGAPRDFRSDLYALGMLGYLMLTGQRARADWELPSACRPELVEGWDWLLSRCLQAEPAERYPGPAAFLSDLSEVDQLPRAVEGEGDAGRSKLDRIPLPRQVTARASRSVQTTLRLVVLALFGLAAVALGQWCLQILFAPEASEPLPAIHRVSSAEAALLRLELEPALVRVRVAGETAQTFISRGGQLWLSMPPGRYAVRIDAPFHRAEALSIVVDGAPQARRVELQRDWAQVAVEGPPGLSVFAEARDTATPEMPTGEPVLLGQVAPTGSLALDQVLLAGTYRFTFEREGYERLETDWIDLPSGEPYTLQPACVPLPGSLALSCPTPGARVYWQGEPLGMLPLTLTDAPLDTPLELEVAAPDHRPYRMEARVLPGRDSTLEVPALERLEGQLRLSLSAPGTRLPVPPLEDWSLDVGDEPYALSRREALVLPAGAHELRLEHPDWIDVVQGIAIRDRQDAVLELEVAPRPARLRLALPEGLSARVRIRESGVTLTQTPEGWYALPPGEAATLLLHIRDHKPLQWKVEPEPRETLTWAPRLERLPAPEPGQDWQHPYLGWELVWLPAGRVRVGSPKEELLRLPNEGPQTQVQLSRGFWVARCEVTQKTYRAVTGTNPSQYLHPDHPVESLSWHEALAFVEALDAREAEAGRLPEGYQYRLPTEAEWEYFARAGGAAPYSFGTVASDAQGAFQGQYPPVQQGAVLAIETSRAYGPRAVAQFPPNAWGLHDVHGNVAEWCLDTYADRWPGGTRRDWVRQGEGGPRVARGGSWADFAHRTRSAAREGVRAEARRDTLGLRIVLAPRPAAGTPQ